MEPDPPVEAEPIPPRQSAGAYGFSRNELRGLVVIGLLAGAWIIYEWYERHYSQTVPAWVMEDVVIDQSSPADSAGAKQPQREVRSAAEDPGHTLVDVNTAGRGELIRLPGIGPTLAMRIIEDREKNGPFANLQDLQRVRGIGPKTATALAGWLRFSSVPVAPAETTVEVQ